MAVVKVEGFADLDEMFRKLGDVPFDVTARALDAMAEEGERAVRSTGAAMGVRDEESDTHILDHVTHSRPRQTDDGGKTAVTFSGSRTRGNTKTRNAEIAFVNEYGKKNQAARPFIRQAAEQYADQIAAPGEQVLGDWQEQTFSS